MKSNPKSNCVEIEQKDELKSSETFSRNDGRGDKFGNKTEYIQIK